MLPVFTVCVASSRRWFEDVTNRTYRRGDAVTTVNGDVSQVIFEQRGACENAAIMAIDGEGDSKTFSNEAMAQTAQILFLGIAAQLDAARLRRELEQLANLPTQSRLADVREVVLAFAAQLNPAAAQRRPADTVRIRLRALSFFVGASSFGLCAGALCARAFFPAAYALVLAL